MSAEQCARRGCGCEATPPDGFCSDHCADAEAQRVAPGAPESAGACQCGHPPCGPQVVELG